MKRQGKGKIYALTEACSTKNQRHLTINKQHLSMMYSVTIWQYGYIDYGYVRKLKTIIWNKLSCGQFNFKLFQIVTHIYLKVENVIDIIIIVLRFPIQPMLKHDETLLEKKNSKSHICNVGM